MNNDVSIIIVTFNNESTIIRCLDSIIKDYPDPQILVLDNNSTDNTVRLIEKFGKRIEFIKSHINLGFSKGNNLAAKKARGDYLIFLNPDAKFIQKNTITRFCKLLEENQRFALLGPKILFHDGSVQESVRKLPTLWGAIKEYIFKIKGSYDFYMPSCQIICEVESVAGACICISREIFLRFGGFDERYFLYFEDLQLCKKLRENGFKVGFVDDIKIEHQVGVSGSKTDTAKLSFESSKIYHGKFKFLLIQYIGRLGNKFFKK